VQFQGNCGGSGDTTGCGITYLSILAADLAQPHRLFLAVKGVDTTLVADSLHTSAMQIMV